MGIRYYIDQEKGITFVLWDGVVTADEFLAHVRHLSSDVNWPPPERLHISDLRRTSLDPSMDEAIITKAAKMYGEQQDKIANMRVAIVAGDAFDKAVVFERVISRYGASVIVFNVLNTACKWLGIDVTEAKPMLQRLRTQLRGETN